MLKSLLCRDIIIIDIQTQQAYFMSIYTAEFASLDGRNYKIEIKTKKGSGSYTLTLGKSPFTTSMDNEGKTIYSTIKSQGATIGIIVSDLIRDLYDGAAMSTEVKLINTTTNSVEWLGFLEPCVYDQGWDEEREEMDLDCVDSLAAFKDIYYPNPSGVATFAEVLYTILHKDVRIKNLYISDNVQIASASANESVIERFRISQQNFFDKKEDENQADNEVAWNCFDVLSEMMQFLGYTMFMQGENVYCVNYDAIKNGNAKYFKYDLSKGSLTNPTTVTLTSNKHIDAPEYSENGTKVSLDDVYNFCSIKDDFYTYDSMFPTFGDKKFEHVITPDTDSAFLSYNTNYITEERDTFKQRDRNGNSQNYQIFVAKGWRKRMWLVIAKFLSSDALKFHRYSFQTAAHAEETNTYAEKMGWGDLYKTHGAAYYRIYTKEISSKEYNSWRVNYPSNWRSMSEQQRKDAWTALLTKNPEGLSLVPYVVFTNHDTNHIGPAAANITGKYNDRTDDEDCTYYPFVSLKNDSSEIFGGEGAYLVIQGSVLQHDETGTPFPLSDGADNGKLKREKDYKYGDECFMWARLKWGNNWWNGEGWQSTKCNFKIWWRDPSYGKLRCKDYFDKWFDFYDTATAYGCKDKGVYIPCPLIGNLDGTAEFIVFANRSSYGDSRRSHWGADNNYGGCRYSRYHNKIQVIKNLQVKVCVSNGLLDDKGNDSDTIYCNVIGEDYVKKMNEIKWKICTNDGKKPNYSSVSYYDASGQSQYVKYTYNKALRTKEINDGCKSQMVQEEHAIFALVKQYIDPRVNFECNLHNDGHMLYGLYTDKSLGSGTKMIIDKMEIDYKQNSVNLELIEKY